MVRKLICKLGIHKLIPVDFESMNYRDYKHGWVEQEECTICGYKTKIREYY